MQDRYLCKAKRTDNGEWVTGYYVKTVEESYIIVPYKHSTLLGEGKTIIVNADTICQCTGLKDKNGKLIWENDIVLIPGDEEPCLIVWEDDTARWSIEEYGSCVCDFDNYWGYELEVIGNKFDNPELGVE